MIDCHMHFDEAMVSISGLLESMDRFGVEKAALIAAIQGPLEMTPLVKYGSPILRNLLFSRSSFKRKLGEKVYNDMVKDDGTVGVGGKRMDLFVQPRNDDVIEAVSKAPDRLYGWIFVNPAGTVDPVAEVERCLEAPGMIGVKAHSFWHNYPVSMLTDVAALCEERGLPILIHIGTDEVGDYRLLPEKFPRLKVVYAHAGVPYQREICDYAGKRENVYVDFAGDGYLDVKIGKEAIKHAGANKCMFGSDGPYFHAEDDRFDYNRAVDIFRGLGLSESESEMVGGRNFEEIVSGRR